MSLISRRAASSGATARLRSQNSQALRRKPRRWRRIVLSILGILVVAALSYVGYAAYKVNNFVDSAFRKEDKPPITE